MKDKNDSLELLIKETVNNGILEAIGDAVSIHDINFKILFQNEKARKIIGNHMGKFCYEAFECRDNVCEGCPLALSFADGRVRTVERPNPVKKELTVEVTSSAVKDSTGKIIAGIQVLRDITKRKRLEEERENLIREMKDELATVKTLKGYLPVCASCNKVRDDKNNWTPFDVYIHDHSEAEITHGYCPECASKHFSTDDKNVY